MAAWPTLDEVRSLLRLQPDATEDGFIASALAAAVDHGVGRMGSNLAWSDVGSAWVKVPSYPPDTDQLPDRAHEACLLHAARLYRRRDSVDGTIGFGDMGVVRVGRTDADVEMLYASAGPVVFG